MMDQGSAPVRRLIHADDQLRLMAKIARMYHEQGMRQSQIASELHVSQPRVSRMLKRAGEIGIVRTTVALPSGVYTDLEEALERRYGLTEAVIVDSDGVETDETPSLGAAAAAYLETTLIGGEIIGISSWSATLLAAARSMRPSRSQVADAVVQLVGGLGEPGVQMQANSLMAMFAQCTGASPVFMPAPHMLGSTQAREALIHDPSLATVMGLWPRLTMALVGIGSLEPSPLLRDSGNGLTDLEQEHLRRDGAVGDVCLRFFDAGGDALPSDVDDRVLGISPAMLRAVPRRVGVAGGARKHAAIRAALLGGWVNVLITDLAEARRLLGDQDV